MLFLKIETKQGNLFSPLPFNIVLEERASAIKQEKGFVFKKVEWTFKHPKVLKNISSLKILLGQRNQNRTRFFLMIIKPHEKTELNLSSPLIKFLLFIAPIFTTQLKFRPSERPYMRLFPLILSITAA